VDAARACNVQNVTIGTEILHCRGPLRNTSSILGVHKDVQLASTVFSDYLQV
jgi:hypothetical protein